MIAQPTNSGLGNIAWGFSEHMEFSKILLVDYKPIAIFPERFPNRRITKSVNQEDMDWLLDGIDTLLFFETPYHQDLPELAHEKGIKNIFMPMDEWLDTSSPWLKYVDLFLCPSRPTYERVSGNKIMVDSEVPVDCGKFDGKIRKRAKVFLHNSGHGGFNNRNSTPELMEAIPFVKSDVKFIINAQYPLGNVNDPRVEIHVANYKNYWDMYGEGDVYILPGKYGVAYLGIGEAAACGMAIMFSDIPPFNEYLPREILIPPKRINSRVFTGSDKSNVAYFDPKTIAKKIDEVAAMDITKYSKVSLALAHKWSWENWKDKYKTIFNA